MNTLSTQKHIAMWSCPRSRSTLITRSFEQLDGCIIYDEPLYAPYLLDHAFDHPEREAVMTHRETDYQTVIQMITSDLPQGFDFSFQKQMAKHIKPDDPKQWMRCFNNFFLIRNPKEIILSYHKVCKKVTKDDIGMEHLYYLFKDVQSLTGVTPVVIDSTDLIKNPSVLLKKLCDQLGLQYSDKMLKWESGFKGKTLEFNNPFPWLWTGKLPPTIWYENINQSTGFKPLEEKEKPLPDELKSVFEDCLPFYEKLSRYRITVNECDSIVSA